MNLTAIDIMHIDEHAISEGDFVSVVKNHENIWEINQVMGVGTVLAAFCSFSRLKDKFFYLIR